MSFSPRNCQIVIMSYSGLGKDQSQLRSNERDVSIFGLRQSADRVHLIQRVHCIAHVSKHLFQSLSTLSHLFIYRMAFIPQNIGPYQFEPFRTAEEVRRRREQQQGHDANAPPVDNGRDDRIRQLQARLEGKLGQIFVL